MLKSYIKIAWRNLWKHKVFSLINILGLSIGIAFTLLIGAYVWGQLQVNHQLKNANNQYIILSKWKDPNLGNDITSIADLPKSLADNYPNLVANYYHFDGVSTNVSKGDMHYREAIQLGDSTLLKMYGFKLLDGDARTALNDPFAVVITQKMALKYFGKTEVAGQTLSFESMHGDHHDFMITGVLAPIGKNSVTDLIAGSGSEFFFPAAAAKYFNRTLTGWVNAGTVDYLELKAGVDPKTVDRAIASLMQKLEPDQVIRTSLTPYLVNLQDYSMTANGGLVKKMTRTLSGIAFFILLMAIINFVNICVGRASGRMREMGIRKVMGGLRKQLIGQFLAESTLMVAIATAIALIIYLIARPYFSDILGSDLAGLFNFPLYLPLVLVLFVLLIGMIAGIYPALVLSALKSVDSLKGKLSSVKESVAFRKTLVAFQFLTAGTVLIGAIIISKQVNLFFNGNLGYDKNYIVYAQVPRDWTPQGVNKIENIRQQLLQMPQVSNATLSYEIPDGHNGGNYLVYPQSNKTHIISVTGMVTDGNYTAVYNIPLKAGTFLNRTYSPADSVQIAVNQSQAAALGWRNPADAVGQKVIIPAYSNTEPYTICGVTADFVFGSMRTQTGPVTFMNVYKTNLYRYFSIKLKPGNLQGSIAALQKKWGELLPGAPFEYHFMDDALGKLYSNEIHLKKAAYIATGLAMVIVLLGVLGLISLGIQKRTKEIGIRKVLGATVTSIVGMLSSDFLKLVAIAALIAFPIGWYAMNSWLQGFAYRTSINWWVFVIAGVLSVFITIATVSFRAIKAALMNPVNSLRSE